MILSLASLAPPFTRPRGLGFSHRLLKKKSIPVLKKPPDTPEIFLRGNARIYFMGDYLGTI